MENKAKKGLRFIQNVSESEHALIWIHSNPGHGDPQRLESRLDFLFLVLDDISPSIQKDLLKLCNLILQVTPDYHFE